MESISIRHGNASDAAVLAEFAARTFAETFAADNNPEDMQAFLETTYGIPQQTQELTDPNVITLLVHEAQTLVAFAQVRRGPPPHCVTQPNPIELQRFYVDRPAHGKGIAQKLMAEVRQAAKELSGQHLWLGVWEHNPRAITFYQKMGFVEVGSHDFFVGPDRQTDQIMVTKLENS